MLCDCDCEFDADPSDPDEATAETSWHYKRICAVLWRKRHSTYIGLRPTVISKVWGSSVSRVFSIFMLASMFSAISVETRASQILCFCPGVNRLGEVFFSKYSSNFNLAIRSRSKARFASAAARIACLDCNASAWWRSSARRSFIPSDQNWSTVKMPVATAAKAAMPSDQSMPFQDKTYHQSAYSGEGPHDIEQRTYELTVFLWVIATIIVGFVATIAILGKCFRGRKGG